MKGILVNLIMDIFGIEGNTCISKTITFQEPLHPMSPKKKKIFL